MRLLGNCGLLLGMHDVVPGSLASGDFILTWIYVVVFAHSGIGCFKDAVTTRPEPGTSNLQPPTSNLQPATSNVQPPTSSHRPRILKAPDELPRQAQPGTARSRAAY